MDPALLAVRAQHQPVGAALLEQLDLVALVEDADLVATQLVGRVEQADDVVADQPPLAAVERADQAVSKVSRGGLDAVADRVGLARLRAATAGASAACLPRASSDVGGARRSPRPPRRPPIRRMPTA